MEKFLRRLGIFRKIFDVIDDFDKKSPLQKWNYFRGAGSMVLRVTGVNILDPSFKIKPHSALCGFLTLEYVCMIFYNAWFFRDNVFVACRALSAVGAALPVKSFVIQENSIENDFSCYFQTFVVYTNIVRPAQAKRFQALLFFAGRCIYKDHDASPKYTKVCNESGILLVKTAIEDVLILLIAVFMMVGLPIYLYLFEHQHVLMIPFVLPFIDAETTTGYYITQIHHAIFGFIGFSGIVGFELIKEILKNAYYAQSVAIQYSLDSLLDCKTDDRLLNMRMRNILAQNCDADRFMVEWIDLFYWAFLVQPTLLTFSIGITLFLFIVVPFGSVVDFFFRFCKFIYLFIY